MIMLFWIWPLLIVGVVAFLLLRALRAKAGDGLSAVASDMAVYRDQLKEVDRDLARGVLSETEAEAVGNLLPVEAARLARDLGWDTLIPGHNDLYPNNAIPQGEIIAALEAIHPRQKVKLLQPGELLYYVK